MLIKKCNDKPIYFLEVTKDTETELTKSLDYNKHIVTVIDTPVKSI